MNGATDGATMESSQPRAHMNVGSAPDWEVMIEHVTLQGGVARRQFPRPRRFAPSGFFPSLARVGFHGRGMVLTALGLTTLK